jgi:flavodoxin
MILPAAVLLIALTSQANDTLTATTPKVLFVYDTNNKATKIYIEAIRSRLSGDGFTVDEASSSSLKKKDPSSYDKIVIYGMVMAFNAKSMVRNWLKAQKDLAGKKVYIFVTANRWSEEKLHKDLVKLSAKKKAIVVDAVSMATNKVSDEKKREKAVEFLVKIKN